MSHKRKTSIATLALLFALAVAPKSLAASRWASNSNSESYPTRAKTVTASIEASGGPSGDGKLVVKGGKSPQAAVPTSVLWPNGNWQSPGKGRPEDFAIATLPSISESSVGILPLADSRLETLQGKSIESSPSDSGVMLASSTAQIPVWLLTILPAAALLGVLLWWMQRDDRTPKSTTAEKQDLPESSKVEESENLVSESDPEPHPAVSAEPATEEVPLSPDAHRTAIETSESEKTDMTDIQDSETPTVIQDLDDTHIQDLDDTHIQDLDDTHIQDLDDTHIQDLDDTHIQDLETPTVIQDLDDTHIQEPETPTVIQDSDDTHIQDLETPTVIQDSDDTHIQDLETPTVIQDSDDTHIQDLDDTHIQEPETPTVSESAEVSPISEAKNIDRSEMAIADANVTSTAAQPSPDIAETEMGASEPKPEVENLESSPVEAQTDLEMPEPEPEPEFSEISKQTTLTGGQAWVVGAGDDRGQLDVESKKFNVGQEDDAETLGVDVDRGLPELPEGYDRNCIVFMPRDPNWAYAYWDIGNEHREPLRKKGGKQLALRVYDVTWIDMDQQRPHSMKQYECDELAREWHIPIPMSDRDYIVEIGYITDSGYWLVLSRSESVHIPPIYPCDHYGDRFYTIPWEEDLRGKTI